MTSQLVLGFLTGMMLARIIYKWPHIDIEASAFVNGYDEGYYDGERRLPREREPWDGLKWRERYPEPQEEAKSG